MSVVIETTIGDITVDLYTETRPTTCMNFLKLCKMKYYNFNLIFSVERNFIAQTGDPTATGKGGESMYHKMYGDQAKYYEGEKLPIIKHTKLGTVSMVSCGNHLFGSQFFVTLGEDLDSLDAEHLVFGEVVEGARVIDRLNETLTDERNRPYQDIRITHTVVLEDPYRDPKELTFPEHSPEPTSDVFESDYIAADETIDDTEGKSVTEIDEEIREKEAKARATILEMVGDLPDSDIAPPENVLFVCKLNPVTTSEDLEIIFSRFGEIKTCEVIRDKVTQNSLQYAFVEFAETKSCEDAYFKMDNVLIDDRRVHVDFSQSVSKIKWRGKGRGVEYFDEHGRKVDRDNDKRRGGKHEGNQSRASRGGNSGRGRGRGYQSERGPNHHYHHQRNYQEADRTTSHRRTLEQNEGRRTDERDRKQNNNRNYQDTDRTRGQNEGRRTDQREGKQNNRPSYQNTHRTFEQNEGRTNQTEHSNRRNHQTDRTTTTTTTTSQTRHTERRNDSQPHRDNRNKNDAREFERETDNDPDFRDKMMERLRKDIKKKKKKKKRKRADSNDTSSEDDSKRGKGDSSSSEEEEERRRNKRKRKRKSESDSDNAKRRHKSSSKKKKKKNSKKKSKKKYYKSSSSSSSSSDSSD